MAVPTLQQTAWLFTREDESVRMLVQSAAGGVQLVIFGPGNASSTFEFKDMDTLTMFREAYTQRLLGQHYRLQATAERRQAPALRAVPRPSGAERRRRDSVRKDRPAE